jgi:uncharacterized protein (TIGR02266 family)
MTEPEDGDADRRRHDRTPLALLVQFRFSTLQDFLAEYARDLSPGGLFIRSEAPRAEGEVLSLQLSLQDGSRLIEGLGRVVRVDPPGVPGRPAGMGVKFLDLTPESRALVDALCAGAPPRVG